MYPHRYPRAIFFDLDETLLCNTAGFDQIIVETFAEVCPDAVRSGTLAPQASAAIRNSANEIWQNMFDYRAQGRDALAEVFCAALQALELDTAIAPAIGNVFAQRASAATELMQGAQELLETLAASNIVVGVITNGIESMQREKIHRHNLQQHIDAIIVSEHAGAHKPSARVFEFALGQLNVAASEAWHVGDHPLNDVTGAIASGMTGILYAPTDDHLAKYNVADTPLRKPHHTVAELQQLQQLLEQIEKA